MKKSIAALALLAVLGVAATPVLAAEAAPSPAPQAANPATPSEGSMMKVKGKHHANKGKHMRKHKKGAEEAAPAGTAQ